MRRTRVGGDGLADRMRAALHATMLTQAEFGRRMGKNNQQQVADWLSGRKKPGAVNLKLFAEVAGVATDDLLGVRSCPPAAEMFVEATDTPSHVSLLPALGDPTLTWKEQILLQSYRASSPERQQAVFDFAVEGVD